MPPLKIAAGSPWPITISTPTSARITNRNVIRDGALRASAADASSVISGLVATISAACSGVVCASPANASRLKPAMPAEPNRNSSSPRPSSRIARRPSKYHSRARKPIVANA